MARFRRSRRSGSGGFGGLGGGNMIDAGLKGVGAAALAKRFLGAPLGNFTGAAAGFLMTKSIWGAAGGFGHDNIGNVQPGQAGTNAPIYG
jgi:hypothetical protein